MSEEIAGKAYSSAAESVSKAHGYAVAKTKAQIEKAKSDALMKLGS